MPQPSLEPISHRILDNFVEAMALPDGDGYFYTLSSNNVVHYDGDLTTKDRGPFPKIIIASGDIRNNGGSHGDSDTYMGEEMDVEVSAWLGRTADVQRDLKRIEHDLRKAARVDKTRGGLAWTTEWQETEPFYPANNEERAFVVLRFIVQYEVNESDTTVYP